MIQSRRPGTSGSTLEKTTNFVPLLILWTKRRFNLLFKGSPITKSQSEFKKSEIRRSQKVAYLSVLVLDLLWWPHPIHHWLLGLSSSTPHQVVGRRGRHTHPHIHVHLRLVDVSEPLLFSVKTVCVLHWTLEPLQELLLGFFEQPPRPYANPWWPVVFVSHMHL